MRPRCSAYLELRGDEILLLDGTTLPSDAAVLGLGCGQRYHLVRLLGNGLGLFGA
jgi:hypothetical protein